MHTGVWNTRRLYATPMVPLPIFLSTDGLIGSNGTVRMDSSAASCCLHAALGSQPRRPFNIQHSTFDIKR